MLSKKSLTEDLLTYGYVTNASSLKLKVVLPSGFMGIVEPTNISNAFTTKLQNLVDSHNRKGPKMENHFQSLFPSGSFIICKVMNPDSIPIKLSVNPKDINQNVFSSQIRSNMVFVGCVNSIEDHGYTIDFGISNISAFLSNKHAEEYIDIFNNGNPLEIGQQLRCLILSAPTDRENRNKETRTITVSIDPLLIDSNVISFSMNMSYTCIQPGLKVEVKVVKIQGNCLNVKFHNYEGVIPKIYWDLGDKKFKNDSIIQATVVFVDHKEKLLTFSLLNHYHNPVSDLFPKYKEGQTKTGIVQSVNQKLGIYFGLPKGILGIADLQGLSTKGASSIEEAYAVGSEHKCRVIGFLPVENLAQVSVKSIEKDLQFLTIKDIIPGDLITCKVRNFVEQGILASINEKLIGVIKNAHVDDDLSKSPEELFGEGDKISCRVLNLDLKLNRIFLTSKRSLVKSSFPIVWRFDQIKEEMLIQGFVKFINNTGLLIGFFGDLTAWLPKKCLHLGYNTLPSSVYKVGQSIKCKVFKVIPEEEKFLITRHGVENESLTLEKIEDIPTPKIEEEVKKKVPKVKKDIPAPEVGKLTKCVLHKKTDKSFSVFLIPSQKPALIPKMHLSDSLEMCEKMWNTYEPGLILNVVIFEKTNSFIVASHKNSLLKASKNETIVHSFNELKVGQVLVGVVQNIVDYGIFVEFPGRTIGLARTRFITYRRDLIIDRYFKPGVTVEAKVIEINKEKQRFCITLIVRDVGVDLKFGLKSLRNNFKEEEEFKQNFEEIKGPDCPLKDVDVGSIYPIIVKSMTEDGVQCELKNGLKGFVKKEHMKGLNLKNGSSVKGLVIDIDHVSNSVELCLTPEIILFAIKRAKKTILNEIPPKTPIKSVVLFSKSDYILVMLTTKAKGQLAYLCPKIHQNDLTSGERFHINDNLIVKYVKNIDGRMVVKLHSSDKNLNKMKIPEKKEKKSKETVACNKENVTKSKKDDLQLNGSSKTKKKEKKRKNSELHDEIEEEIVEPSKKLKTKKCDKINDDDDIDSCVNNKVLDVMPPVFFDWNETSNGQINHDNDASEEEERNQDETDLKKSKKKLKENRLKEEQRLFEIERKRLEGVKQMETAEDFDCLVLNSPNSSLLWLRYMAFHLETAEVDKARAVAERALKTISFREEQEKFNIWIGYLNLENLYGTKEKLAKVLERALQQNQPIKVYQQLVNIYIKSGKIQQAEDVHHILLKRFRSEKDVWVHYAVFCFKNSHLEEGRKLIERAVKSLDKKDHVSLIVKVAQLEFKYGESERGKTMFENIVGNFPKRTDLWSVYIDMTIQQEDHNSVRDLFERVTNLRLSPRKMKFFFKKYLDFEQKYGTPELVMGVRKKALGYVEDNDIESGSET